MPSEPAQSTGAALPLYQLADAIQHVLDEQFAGTHLLTAEIASLSDSNARGHCYLELIDKDPRTGQECRMRAAIWAQRYRVISHYFLQETGQRLAKGLQILFEAELTFHPTYGLSLSILQIDTAYTLGRQQQALAQILVQLTQEGLLEVQQELAVPPLFQRIAVISSPSAAGYQDFVHQLENNVGGYHFPLTLFTAIMQGADTEGSVINALSAVLKRQKEFDAVVLIRGGGADQDLVGFNTYALGKALATFPLPILTGIGHERDHTVPDLVAYQHLKTPTAVAEFLVERASGFEAEIDEAVEGTEAAMRVYLLEHQQKLAQLENSLVRAGSRLLPAQRGVLATLAERLAAAAAKELASKTYQVQYLEGQLHLLDPRVQLKRGFALVYTKKGLAKSTKELEGELTIRLQDGQRSGHFKPQ